MINHWKRDEYVLSELLKFNLRYHFWRVSNSVDLLTLLFYWPMIPPPSSWLHMKGLNIRNVKNRYTFSQEKFPSNAREEKMEKIESSYLSCPSLHWYTSPPPSSSNIQISKNEKKKTTFGCQDYLLRLACGAWHWVFQLGLFWLLLCMLEIAWLEKYVLIN